MHKYTESHYLLSSAGVATYTHFTSMDRHRLQVQMGYAFNPSAAAPGLIKMPSINTTFTTSRHTVEDLRDMKPTNISVSTIFTQVSMQLLAAIGQLININYTFIK